MKLTEEDLYDMTRDFFRGSLTEAKASDESFEEEPTPARINDRQLLGRIASLIKKLRASHPAEAIDMIEEMIASHKSSSAVDQVEEPRFLEWPKTGRDKRGNHYYDEFHPPPVDFEEDV